MEKLTAAQLGVLAELFGYIMREVDVCREAARARGKITAPYEDCGALIDLIAGAKPDTFFIHRTLYLMAYKPLGVWITTDEPEREEVAVLSDVALVTLRVMLGYPAHG